MARSKTKADTAPRFNLASRSVRDTCTVEIVDPEDGTTKTGIRITLATRFSKHATAAALAMGEAERASGDKGSEKAKGSERTDWVTRLLPLVAACTLSWDGLEDGDTVPACTAEEATRIYTAYPWLYEQVQTAYLGKTAFFDATARTS